MKPNNEPAFPFEYHNQTSTRQKSFVSERLIPPDGAEQYSGMTLRDYFAAHASDKDVEDYYSPAEGIGRVQARYMFADAMLSERNK